MSETTVDALVVGAGFGGIYQLKKLRDQGLSAIAIDIASDVGGTWYWNRYPGAMSDTETYLYRYSWDLEDLRSYPWSTHYVYQPEILRYLQHITDKFDLRKHMHFNTELTTAKWDDESGRWIVGTSSGKTIKARYLVTALGLLSRQNLPDFEGINDFAGEMYHTGRWPESVDLRGKRVGVIGNGSTGVQVITTIAKDVKKLVCFQRNPQYSVPSGQGPINEGYRKQINDNYPKIWEDAKDHSLFGFGFKETDRPTFSVSEEERERIYEEAWQKGGGFRFMFETFGDISVNEAANNAATDFIKRKIMAAVKDPEKAKKLLPTQLYARRPLCDAGYYEQFNRDHVDVVSLQETPIAKFTPKGIVTSGANGTEHELDVVIFATGFDAVDGNYTRVAIQGRNGETLKQHWEPRGSTSYLGTSVPNFPNLFMILGPNGPFCNLPPAIETQVEFISDTIEEAERRHQKAPNGTVALNGHVNGVGSSHRHGPVVEATDTAEDEWTELCDKLSADSLFRKTDSWIFGSNVSGKKRTVLFYFAGLAAYRQVLREVVKENYKGFKPF